MLQKMTVCGVDVNIHCRRYLESVPTDIYVFIYLPMREKFVVLVTAQRLERIP